MRHAEGRERVADLRRPVVPARARACARRGRRLAADPRIGKPHLPAADDDGARAGAAAAGAAAEGDGRGGSRALAHGDGKPSAERAEVEYDELFEDEAGNASCAIGKAKLPPPVLSGFMHKLRPGTMCEPNDGGRWEVAVIDRKKGSGGGLALRESPLYK